MGAYRTDAGKPWILPVVKKAEQKLAQAGYARPLVPLVSIWRNQGKTKLFWLI